MKRRQILKDPINLIYSFFFITIRVRQNIWNILSVLVQKNASCRDFFLPRQENSLTCE